MSNSNDARDPTKKNDFRTGSDGSTVGIVAGTAKTDKDDATSASGLVADRNERESLIQTAAN